MWRYAGENWSQVSEELPLHRVLDLSILICRSLAHFREAYRYENLYDPQEPVIEGSYALKDMQQTIEEYERKGITFLAAAIGQDRDVISEIYGGERYLDITNLHELPEKLVRIITRYL